MTTAKASPDEHDAQRALTNRWRREGLTLDTGERLMLVGYEVQFPKSSAEWANNDNRGDWGAGPSVDFVLMNEAGALVLLELKRDLRRPRDACTVACQVSICAAGAFLTYSPENLRRAFAANRAGVHGLRKWPEDVPMPEEDLAEAHRRFFNLGSAAAWPTAETVIVRRMIGVKSISDSAVGIVGAFNTRPMAEVAAELSASYGAAKSNKKIRTFIEDHGKWPLGAMARPIEVVRLDWPEGEPYAASLGESSL